MKHKKVVIFIVISILISPAPSLPANLSVSQIAEKYSKSVVTIICLDENDQILSLGSGFFVDVNGSIATNHHMLEHCTKATIKTSEGETGEVLEIINDDSELDLSITTTSLKDTTPIPPGDSELIKVGEDIIAIGNPAGLEGTISKGIISGIRKANDIKVIQITASISPGSSGGPVLDSSGKVIGIATAYLDLGQNLNFAMPVNYLTSLKQAQLKIGSLPKVNTGIIQPSQSEFKKSIQLLIKDEGYLASINPFPVSSHAHLLYRNYIVDLMSTEIMLDQMYELIIEYQYTVQDLGKLGKAWGMEIARRGLKRMSDKETEDFLEIMLRLLNRISVVECAKMLRDDSSFNIQTLELLDTSDLGKYLNITKKAMIAELSDNPQPTSVTEEQGEIAYEVLYNQFHEDDALYLALIFNNLSESSDVEVCWASKLLIAGILQMKGEPKKWMLRSYLKNF